MLEMLQEEESDHVDRMNVFHIDLVAPYQTKRKQYNKFEQIGIYLSKKSLLFIEQLLHLKYFDETTETTARKCHPSGRLSESWRSLMKGHSLIYLFVSAWCLINTSYQYRYDINYFKLSKLSSVSGHNETFEEQLAKNLNQSRVALGSIGAPLMEAHFMAGVLHVQGLLLSFISYYTGLFMFAAGIETTFTSGRIVLDPQRECHSISMLIKEILIKFQVSSNQYIQELFCLSGDYFDGLPVEKLIEKYQQEKQLELLFDKNARTSTMTSKGSPNNNTELDVDLKGLIEVINDNQLILRLLKEIIETKQDTRTIKTFKPLSWSHWWVAERSLLLFGPFIVLLIIYTHLLFIVGVYCLIQFIDSNIHWQLMDCLFSICLWVLFLYVDIPLSFGGAASSFNSIEQIIYIRSMVHLINDTIMENRYILARKDFNYRNHPLRNKMNSNLSCCLIHLKIFVKIFEATKQLASLIVLSATCCFFVSPLLVRFNMPYVEAEGAKYVAIFICLSSVLVYNCLLLPACYFHAQSLRLYRSLNSLLAHTISSSMDTKQSSLPIYNEHLVCLLRKELDFPNRLATRFALKIGGFKFTYSSFIRINFWFGLIVISFLSNIETNRNTSPLNQFLRDPLNIMLN